MSNFKCSVCGEQHPLATLGLRCPNYRKHTPGPWTNEGPYHNDLLIIGPAPDHREIAQVCGQDDEAEANARLIAAAPDLLAACEHVAKYTHNLVLAEILRAAIAKARGVK